MAEPAVESACSVARVLALTPDETSNGALSCVSVDDTTNRVSITADNGSQTRVTVDHAFRESIPVEDVYQVSWVCMMTLAANAVFIENGANAGRHLSVH